MSLILNIFSPFYITNFYKPNPALLNMFKNEIKTTWRVFRRNVMIANRLVKKADSLANMYLHIYIHLYQNDKSTTEFYRYYRFLFDKYPAYFIRWIFSNTQRWITKCVVFTFAVIRTILYKCLFKVKKKYGLNASCFWKNNALFISMKDSTT